MNKDECNAEITNTRRRGSELANVCLGNVSDSGRITAAIVLAALLLSETALKITYFVLRAKA